MGRPPTRTAELVSVSVNGRGAAWCDGVFSGDPEVVREAENAALLRAEIPLGHLGMVEADRETPMGATAALHAYSPGRTVIVSAPDGVHDIFDESLAHDDPAAWRA